MFEKNYVVIKYLALISSEMSFSFQFNNCEDLTKTLSVEILY